MFTTFKNSKVLITGDTGFKGSWLAMWLTKLGAEVYGVSDRIKAYPSNFETMNLENSIHHMEIDVTDLRELKSAFLDIKPDFVFHLAAQALVAKSYLDPTNTFLTNVIGTVNVLECLRDMDQTVVAVMVTSDKSYDNVEWLWGYRENDKLGGPDPYSGSKAGAELAIRSYVSSYFKKDGNIRIGVGRAGNVIGGGDWSENRLIPDCVKAWSESKAVKIRNPNSTRPWQHVLEPLSGYLKLASQLSMDSSIHGEAFNFGPSSTEVYSVAKVVKEMQKFWKVKGWELTSDLQVPIKEANLLKLNCDKAFFLLNWKSTWTFEETIGETALWYEAFYSPNVVDMKQLTIDQIERFSLDAQS